MQVKFSWVQSCRQQEQRSCGMLLFSTDYPDQVSVSCFPCKAALLNPASTWLGLCLSVKRPLTEPCSYQGLFPLPQSPTSPPFLFLKCFWCRLAFSPRSCLWIAWHLTEKVQKQISSETLISIRYQKECLRILNGLKPCSSSNIVFAMLVGEMTRSYALCIASICYLRCCKFKVSLLFSQAPIT
jgi:hypothetical protein